MPLSLVPAKVLPKVLITKNALFFSCGLPSRKPLPSRLPMPSGGERGHSMLQFVVTCVMWQKRVFSPSLIIFLRPASLLSVCLSECLCLGRPNMLGSREADWDVSKIVIGVKMSVAMCIVALRRRAGREKRGRELPSAASYASLARETTEDEILSFFPSPSTLSHRSHCCEDTGGGKGLRVRRIVW